MKVYKVSICWMHRDNSKFFSMSHDEFNARHCYVLASRWSEARNLGAQMLELPYRLLSQKVVIEETHLLRFFYNKTDKRTPFEDWVGDMCREMENQHY